jgi:hypothetical protein
MFVDIDPVAFPLFNISTTGILFSASEMTIPDSWFYKNMIQCASNKQPANTNQVNTQLPATNIHTS